MGKRHLSRLDLLLINLDSALRTLHGRPHVTERSRPDAGLEDCELSERERDHVARLMRINHTGEVCAQALYQGQALTARHTGTREQMERAAAEENDHLDWCEHRINELGGRKSLLNPLWYAGSCALGALAGLAGDRWSLGFVAETEAQVERHLDHHIAEIPPQDARSRAILEQMKIDEARHGQLALEGGGRQLPKPIQWAMQATARLMTSSVYRV